MGNQVMKNVEDAEVINVFFALVFTGKACQQVCQASMPAERIQTEVLLTTEEVQGRDHVDK